jgi:hypothetical protein
MRASLRSTLVVTTALVLVALVTVTEPDAALASASLPETTMWSSVAAPEMSAGLWVCADPAGTAVHGDKVRMVVTMGATVAVVTGSVPDASDLKADGAATSGRQPCSARVQMDLPRRFCHSRGAETRGPRRPARRQRGAGGHLPGPLRTRDRPGLPDALYTGGTHCCSVVAVAVPGPHGKLAVLGHDFGNPPARLDTLATERCSSAATTVLLLRSVTSPVRRSLCWRCRFAVTSLRPSDGKSGSTGSAGKAATQLGL